MKFKDFLNEKEYSNGQYKTEISLEDAIHIIKTKCKKVDIHKPFWRGMKGGGNDAYIFKGENGNRKSSDLDFGNYYTVILDHFIKKQNPRNPLRSASIICANTANYKHIKHFGNNRYAIFPYDTTIVGYVNGADIWQSEIKFPNGEVGLYDFNGMLYKASTTKHSVRQDTFEHIVEDIQFIISMDEKDRNKYQNYIHKMFDGDPDNVEEYLKKLFDKDGPIYFFGDSSEDDSAEREVWIGAECIAIKESVYKEILKELE